MKNSKEKTEAVLTVDGQVLKKNSNGTYTPLSSQTDWDRVNHMDDDEVTAIAKNDPDNSD